MTSQMDRWNPLREMLSMQSRLNRMMGDTFGRSYDEPDYGHWMPPVDIREEEDCFVIQAELPGFQSKDIDIQFENGVLTLAGERRFEKEDQKQNYHRIERAYGRFTRSFTLPSGVQGDKVSAAYKEGILEVLVPKAEESKPRKITIK